MDSILTLPLKLILLHLRRLLQSSTELEKENLFLRHQLLVLKRQLKRPKFSTQDRAVLSTIGISLKNAAQSCVIIKPETLFAWHRRLVKWRWTYKNTGRPRTTEQIRTLILRMKKENRIWGGGKIYGELLKLGFKISERTVHNILRETGFAPASTRCKSKSSAIDLRPRSEIQSKNGCSTFA